MHALKSLFQLNFIKLCKIKLENVVKFLYFLNDFCFFFLVFFSTKTVMQLSCLTITVEYA